MDILTKMSEDINGKNAQKGFWDDFEEIKVIHEREGSEFTEAVKTAFINQFLMLITSETAEACEALRKGRRVSKKTKDVIDSYEFGSDQWKKGFQHMVKDTFEDELADVLIRVLDLAGGLGVDIGWHVKNKLEFNSQREAKHGKKF